jgi:hypothetical protein
MDRNHISIWNHPVDTLFLRITMFPWVILFTSENGLDIEFTSCTLVAHATKIPISLAQTSGVPL